MGAHLWSSRPAGSSPRSHLADGAQPVREAMNEATVAGATRAVWGVGALLQASSDALWARFGPVAVRGELSGLSRAASGHWYFSLKDEGGAPALLRCAMFRRAAMLVNFTPADGQRVEVRGRLDLYAARGELQLVAEAMQRVGQGALYEEFLRLRARLEALGLFDAARKRPIPAHPRRVGVVTSRSAAALHDVLTALARRAPHVEVVIYPCLVQGAEAPASIVAALAEAALRREVDTLLLVRGGGSLEDLWAFNDERVVRTVAASPLPLLCGVGHESDVTLADLAADLRAPTPTAAAELAAPAREELLFNLGALEQRLRRAPLRRVQSEAQGLDRRAVALGQPARTLAAQRERLQATGHRLALALGPALQGRTQQLARNAQRLAAQGRLQLERANSKLHQLAARVQSLDPRRVLGRGYAWVEAESGRAITQAAGLVVGQPIRAVWADGSARARVTALEPGADPGDGTHRAAGDDPPTPTAKRADAAA
jgi:exodeoxyribonuclease VII large subunit